MAEEQLAPGLAPVVPRVAYPIIVGSGNLVRSMPTQELIEDEPAIASGNSPRPLMGGALRLDLVFPNVCTGLIVFKAAILSLGCITYMH